MFPRELETSSENQLGSATYDARQRNWKQPRRNFGSLRGSVLYQVTGGGSRGVSPWLFDAQVTRLPATWGANFMCDYLLLFYYTCNILNCIIWTETPSQSVKNNERNKNTIWPQQQKKHCIFLITIVKVPCNKTICYISHAQTFMKFAYIYM